MLRGEVDRLTYTHAESLYTVLRIIPDKGYELPAGGSPFLPAHVTAVGRTDAPAPGTRVQLSGQWTRHAVHGWQFEFERLEVLPPQGKSGLVKYLSSSRFRGVGETLAQRIVDALGDRALEIILEEPERLRGIPGLRAATRDNLVATALADAGTHKANVFLRDLGLGPWQTSAVLRKLGPDCEATVREDPFILAAGIAGIGFTTADRIAASLGIGAEDPRRMRAGLIHVLKSGAEEGHSLLPRARLLGEAMHLFADAVSESALSVALDELARSHELVVEPAEDGAARDDLVYLPHLARSESGVARNLTSLLRAGPLTRLASAEALAENEARTGIVLHPLQREAILGLLAAPVGLLTGGPGVGKTTIVRQLVMLAHAAHARVLLASPTGRAAKRLAETTGEPAQTIHRMLGFEPGTQSFDHDEQNPLDADLVVVDEISMLDVVLAHHLSKAIQPPTRLILVGDPDQLPSVGPGNVLHDLLSAEIFPVHRLTEIYRQDQRSLIVANAHRILEGRMPALPERGDLGSDFYFFPSDDAEQCAERLVEVVTRRIPESFGLRWIDDVQVIAPMYRGACGVDALNERLRAELVPEGADVREIHQGGRTWRTGDRVIHTRNNYEKEVFNGDMGRIAAIYDDSSLMVRYPDREILYTSSDLSDLQPAFAITVHRSQGCEFPAVVLPLVTEHYVMLQRNLLYTAITRARKLVVLVGSQRALRMAIDNAEQGRRESGLAARLRRISAGK